MAPQVIKRDAPLSKADIAALPDKLKIRAVGLRTAEAAYLCGRSVAAMHKWRARGGGPPWIKAGPAEQSGVLYPVGALLDFLGMGERQNSASGPNAA